MFKYLFINLLLFYFSLPFVFSAAEKDNCIPPSIVISEDPGDSGFHLKGIVIIRNHTQSDESYQDQGVTLKGLELTLKEEKRLANRIRCDYIDKPFNESICAQLKTDLVHYYTQLGRPFIIVTIPEQDVTNGVLHIDILESRIGKVTITSNRSRNMVRYKKSLRLKEGAPLQSDVLVSDLEWINRSPFQTAMASYSPGNENGTTDVNIHIEKKRPFRMYAGTDNTGFKETGYERMFLGFVWGNMFNLNHILSYQFTTSSNWDQYQSHMAFYTIPLTWKHEVRFLGGYSHVHVSHLDHPFSTTGNSAQISTRYEIPLPPFFDAVHSLCFGIDYKNTNNNLSFGGVRISKQYVNLFQFVFEYKLQKNWPNRECLFDIEGILSPGALLPNMNNHRFSNLRPGARNQYFYVRGLFEQAYFFSGGEKIKFTCKGQLSTQFLIPSEQFGLGGLYSVRGYQERVINADNAVFLSLEGFCRPLHLLKKSKDMLYFLAFVDYGLGGGQLFLPDQQVATSSLLGVGPGLHYNIGNWLKARVYWGVQVIASPRTSQHGQRFNFNVMVSF